MLTKEENDLVTRTGPGTPAGDLMRRYWQPAALTEELPPERPVKAVRLLGEDLVLFRDGQARYGLLGRRCSHRASDLSVGRLEDSGLRSCSAAGRAAGGSAFSPMRHPGLPRSDEPIPTDAASDHFADARRPSRCARAPRLDSTRALLAESRPEPGAHP